MATSDYSVSIRMEKTIVWQRVDSATSRKWRKTVRVTDKKTVGLESKADADTRMTEVEMFDNITNTAAHKVGDSGLWEVTYTITEESWEDLGRYVGGIYVGA